MYDAYSRFLTYYTDYEFLPRIQAFTPGDVLFFRYSDKDWTEAQRKATGSYYDHTEIHVGRGAVLQANWDGVNLKPLVYDRLKKKDEFKVVRPSGHRDAADLLEARIAQYVRSGVYARKAYLEALRGNNPKNAMGGGRLFTCASFVCRCLADASFSLDDEFDECWTPDELLRLLGRGQEVTELVYKSMDSSEKDAYSIFPMSLDHGSSWNITYNSRRR